MFEDGLCEVESGLYSLSVKFSDINYQAARGEEQAEIFVRLCELYNMLSPGLHMQLSVHNRRIDKDAFRQSMLMGKAGDGLDGYREEIDQMLLDQAIGAESGLVRDKYLTLSARAASREAASALLSKALFPIEQQLGYIGCAVERLSGLKRLSVIHSMTRPGEKLLWDYPSLAVSSLTTKDAVAPDSFDFRPLGSFGLGDRAGCAMFVKDLPAALSDSLIKELTDLPYDIAFSLHIDAVEQSEALEEVKRKLAFLESEQVDHEKKASNSGYSPLLPINLQEASTGVNELLLDLSSRNQRMFKATILAFVSAESEEKLKEAVMLAASAAQKKGCVMAKLNYMQEEGFNSVLPLGKCHLPISRTLTTSSAAVFVPFTAMELFDEGGFCYGSNALTGNLAMLDRRLLNSPAGMILGTPGSGKSFAAKREIASVFLSDPEAEIIVVDPESEYGHFAKALGGEAIKISAGSGAHINPFDITQDYSGSEDPLKLKTEFLMGMFELIVGRGRELTSQQQSIVNRVCQAVYPHDFFTRKSAGSPPTLKGFYEALKDQPEPEAKDLALSLEQYIEGALSVFASETNIDSANRLTVFDIRDLGKQLRPLGMLIVLDQIWCKITANRSAGKRTWVYIDEMQLLFSSESSSEYFFELWSRSRKWGAVPTGITQNIETLLLSDYGRRMLSNSDFLMLFHQSGSDLEEVSGLLKLSVLQQAYASNAKEGQAVMIAGRAVVQIEGSFPRNTDLYRMMTTKIEEAQAFGANGAIEGESGPDA